jgi:hypothetical protein
MSEAPTLSPLTWDGDRAPLAKALVAAQKATESIKKAATNPAFRSKYADLAHVVEGVVPALNNAGVAVIQSPAMDGERVSVTTVLLHESGSSITGTLHLKPTKGDPQGVGSAITYARRYALLAMTGAAPEDDDGNAASKPRASITPDPIGDDFPGAEGSRGRSSYRAKQDGGSERFNELRKEIEGLDSMSAVGLWTKERTEEIKTFPEAWRKTLREELDEQKRFLASLSEDSFREGGSDDVAGNNGALAA